MSGLRGSPNHSVKICYFFSQVFCHELRHTSQTIVPYRPIYPIRIAVKIGLTRSHVETVMAIITFFLFYQQVLKKDFGVGRATRVPHPGSSPSTIGEMSVQPTPDSLRQPFNSAQDDVAKDRLFQTDSGLTGNAAASPGAPQQARTGKGASWKAEYTRLGAEITIRHYSPKTLKSVTKKEAKSPLDLWGMKHEE
jgi:hypothetical protein